MGHVAQQVVHMKEGHTPQSVRSTGRKESQIQEVQKAPSLHFRLSLCNSLNKLFTLPGQSEDVVYE